MTSNVSFSTFTHMKTEAISNMLNKFGKIELTIKPKNYEQLNLMVISKERAEYLEALENRYSWEQENRLAIQEQNERVAKNGLFSDNIRKF